MVDFKNRLKTAREFKNLTKSEFANKLNLKKSYYINFENNNSTTTVNKLKDICSTLQISSLYFLGFTNELKSITPNKLSSYYNVKLKEVREYEDIKIKEIADYIGISIQQYTRNEKGINIMKIEHFKKACEFLNISPDYLLGFVDIKEKIKCERK